MKRLNSIYLRLLLPLGAALLLAMVVAWAIALYLLTNVIERRLDAKLDNATAVLAEGTFPFSPDLIGRLDRIIEAQIILLDEAGNVGLSTGSSAVNDALTGLAAGVIAQSPAEPRYATVAADGSRWRTVVRALSPTRDDRFRYVAAAASLETTQAVTRDAALLLAGAIFLAALVVAWIGNNVTRSITRPITELAKVADRIADGERSFDLTIDQNNEIGTLARALADMSRELDRYEGELSQQSRRSGLGDLAARMAHEVRNPLTAIKMQLQLLEERVDDRDAVQIQSVVDEIRRLELIVESTLLLGRPLDLELKPCDAARLIDDVVVLLRPALEHRRIALDTNIAKDLLAPMDKDRIKQVLLNLINNASDALTDGGRIVVTARRSDASDAIEICVEDSGPGLMVPSTDGQSDKPFGLGLGLTISREIIVAHRGELQEGRSSSLGGARFTIRLPISIIDSDETGT